MKKERALSGVQPSGKLHIGNYLGAIKQFVALQDEYDTYYCVVDEHAITVPQEPKDLRRNTLAIAMAYLAAGIDPKKSVIFVQSHVPAHTELGWILNTMTPLGELERMTQFKDKARTKRNAAEIFQDFAQTHKTYYEKIEAEKNQDQQNAIIFTWFQKSIAYAVEFQDSDEQKNSIMAGLLNYPTLMAADILLYQASVVPVGEDQVQHIELTRSIAKRFNNRFGDTLFVPKVLLQETSARVMALDEPTKKMSKSRPTGCLFIDDSPKDIEQKIKTAVTDSGNEVKYDQKNKPGISNLLEILAGLSGKRIEDIEKRFVGINYGQFKNAVSEEVINHFADFRKKKAAFLKKSLALQKTINSGSKKANKVAHKKLDEVKKKLGLEI